MADVYVRVQKRLYAASAMDFDDLLLQTVKLFRQAPMSSSLQNGSARCW